MSRILEMLKNNQKKLQWVGFVFCVALVSYNQIWGFYFGVACLLIIIIYRQVMKYKSKGTTTEDVEIIEPPKKGSVPVKKNKKKNTRK